MSIRIGGPDSSAFVPVEGQTRGRQVDEEVRSQESASTRGAVHGAVRGREAVLAGLTSATPPPGAMANAAVDVQDLDALKRLIAAQPRSDQYAPEVSVSDWIDTHKDMFAEHRLTNQEAGALLMALDELPTGAWLKVLDTFKTLPAERRGTILENFGLQGLSDHPSLLAGFIDQANRKLGLGMPSLKERAARFEAQGMSPRKAQRKAIKAMLDEGANVLRAFDLPDHTRFMGPINTALESVNDALLGWLFSDFKLDP